MFIHKAFQTADELADFMNDVVIGKMGIIGPLDLDGLTLILDATTVTFVGTALTLNQVVDQINTAMSAAVATIRNYGHNAPFYQQLAIIKATTVIDKDGTANAIFGLSTTADVTVGADAIAKTDIVALMMDTTSAVKGLYRLIYEE